MIIIFIIYNIFILPFYVELLDIRSMISIYARILLR